MTGGLRVRKEPRAPDGLIVVRGGPLDEASLQRAARIAFARFGEYSVLVFGAPDAAALDALAAGPLSGAPAATGPASSSGP